MKMSNNQLTPFCFGDNLVRVHVDENGDPWWVAKDVAKILEIQNIRQNLADLDEDEKADVSILYISSNGVQQNRNVNLISESGLYALIFRSHKPEAKAFSKWARSEVLPSIRKTGRYEKPSRKAAKIELPEDLPPEALELKPALRQRLWRDALDTVRLEGGGIDMAIVWFGKLCRMMACDCVWASSKSWIVNEFVADCCIASPGSRVRSSVLYEAMRKWISGKDMKMPSVKVFGEAMTLIAPNIHSNGSWYCDICLK